MVKAPITPIIVGTAIDWLEVNIKPSWKVFEWGSGFSTIYWSQRVKEIISVEHNIAWRNRLTSLLKKQSGLENYIMYLIPPDDLFLKQAMTNAVASKLSEDPTKYISKHFLTSNFENYVKKIDSYPDEYFDLVFVDGRARSSCIKHALPKIRKGGYLILDNADDVARPYYIMAKQLVKRWNHIEFYGPGLIRKNKWTTTIWTKPYDN
ncbi:MAG: hypothetical protein K940chlam5_00914 [Candidatus Anoxychlamydiales bacterium]|nr:hypothetical protein [Candidatus Anoxychlamydiales bacterium]